MKFVCYPKCSTCKKAQNWLDKKGFKYEIKDIKLDNPTKDELKKWYIKSGLPLKKFFNTSGLKYKELGLSKTLSTMSEDEQLELLATDGMLVKRPILVNGDVVLVGFKQEQWEEKFK